MTNALDSAPEIPPPEVHVAPLEVPTDASTQLQKFREVIASSALEENERKAITQNLDSLNTRVRDAEAQGNTVETRRLLEEFQQQMDILLAAEQIEETLPPAALTTSPSEGTSSKTESMKDKIVLKAKEVAKDFQESSNWTKVGYIAGGVVGFLAVRWLVRKIMGDGKNEGWLKKTGRWMAMLGGTIAGAIGMNHLFKKGVASVLPDGIKDYIPDGVSDAVKNAPKAAVDMGRGAIAAGGNVLSDAKDALSATSESLAQNWDPRNPESSLKVLLDSGAIILWDGISFIGYVAAENLGKGVVLNGLTMVKMAEILATRSINDDFFYVYAEGGASYLIGKKALNLVMQGKLNIPMTKKDAIVTVLRIAGGPLDMVTDLLSHSSLALRRGGLKAIRLRYVNKSLPMVPVRWSYESVYLRKIDSEKKLMKAVELWSERADELTTMRNFSYGGFDLFSEAEVNKAERNLETFRESIREASQIVPLQNESPEILKEMKKNADLKEKFNEKLQVLWNEHQQRLKNPPAVINNQVTGPKLAEGTEPSGNVNPDTPPPERRMAAGGESIGQPKERPDLRIDPDTVPDEAERIIAQAADNADEAAAMRRGMSVLTKLGVGVDALFLGYETYQVANMWLEIGKLEEEGKIEATLQKAAELKQPVAVTHTQALAVDALATGAGAVYVLTGKLAIVGTAAGGFTLIALPVGMAVRAGMYSSLAEFELQNHITLTDRIRGTDEKATGKSSTEQLKDLGSPSLTLRLGAALSSATIEDIENATLEHRQEILLAMTLKNLRTMAPKKYAKLVTRLGANGLNGFLNERIVQKSLLPRMTDLLIQRAQSNKTLTPADEQKLRNFNIGKGFFRNALLTEQDLDDVAYDAAQILEKWVDGSDGVPDKEQMQSVIQEMKEDKKRTGEAKLKEAFGSHTQEIMSLSPTEFSALRQEFANTLVNINYFDHSALEGIVTWKKRNNFAIDRAIAIPRLRTQLDAMNFYGRAVLMMAKLEIQPRPQSGFMESVLSPKEAFLVAGHYSLSDSLIARWGTEQPGDEMMIMEDVRDLQERSNRSTWYFQAVRSYRKLVDRFEEPVLQETKAA